MKGNSINWNTYKEIKKKNRQEMNDYFQYIYKMGFRAGVDAGDKADFKIKLVEILSNTKGIGPKRFDAIMATAKEIGI